MDRIGRAWEFGGHSMRAVAATGCGPVTLAVSVVGTRFHPSELSQRSEYKLLWPPWSDDRWRMSWHAVVPPVSLSRLWRWTSDRQEQPFWFRRRSTLHHIHYVSHDGDARVTPHPGSLERCLEDVCPPGDPSSEAWFFVNGICTDERMGIENTSRLAEMFARSITLVHNATSGVFADVVEVSRGRSDSARATEAAQKMLPAILAALHDPNNSRVVVIAHSQGTIVTSNVLKRLQEMGAGQSLCDVTARMDPAELSQPEREAASQEPEAVTDSQWRKLEVYAFANCARRMQHVSEPTAGEPRAPWIESYANELDVVPRLGSLAPNQVEDEVDISGPLYLRVKADNGLGRGHLLNEHYLSDVASVDRPAEGPDPYYLVDDKDTPSRGTSNTKPASGIASGVDCAAPPRLFTYLGGGGSAQPNQPAPGASAGG